MFLVTNENMGLCLYIGSLSLQFQEILLKPDVVWDGNNFEILDKKLANCQMRNVVLHTTNFGENVAPENTKIGITCN